ncbi:MAG: hypothetical protein DI598_19295 [Pseudopedobacter saltans]|uniref:YdhG-like domain-containing protein n=1 Tax=Pseudopedobacter saltans TaxID=151895 RepID=A0A2W5EBZ4_9SPHI|nr:MAG: hypothetical protein DI598_19295 [Pseudopedobacter saltans]
MNTNSNVDDFIQKLKRWKNEIILLREIVSQYNLNEDYKWKQPCYTFNEHNVFIISSFKEYCLLGFFNGVLLEDKFDLLHKPGENSQTMRQLRFTSSDEIHSKEKEIGFYIKATIHIAQSGKKVEIPKNTEQDFPIELLQKFEQEPAFKKAFEALTPGRQRAYNIFFSQAKQSETKIARIAKCTEQILQGKGLRD